MLRANFFLNFLKYKQNNVHDILQYNSVDKFELQDKINLQIIDVDKKISETSHALMEAQIVKFKSTFSRSNNFIEKIGKNVYKTKLDDSINWHQKQLKYLYIRRRELEINQEKLKGIFWINKIKRLLNIILIGVFIFLTLFIFFSGFMIIIYLMPLIILIFLVYLISTKR
tara:strand:+ start:83 stop:592 length:510 start_codon:yes stop_codon:yes gene_type:complete